MVYVLALLSAAFYGAGDFVGGFASRRAPVFTVLTVSQSVGLAVLVLALPLLGPAMPARADLLWGAAAGLAGGVGVALLYRGLAIGTMGVVAPTTSVCAVAVPVLAGIGLGERPLPLVSGGILLAVVAIALLGQQSAERGDAVPPGRPGRVAAGMPHALASGVAMGLFYLLLARSRPEAGLWPLVAARAAAVPCFAAAAAAGGASFRLRPWLLALVVAGGVVDMLAGVAYLLATHYGELAVAVTLSSLYPASTVVLARVVLKERPGRLQLTGIALALAAVALIVAGGQRPRQVADLGGRPAGETR